MINAIPILPGDMMPYGTDAHVNRSRPTSPSFPGKVIGWYRRGDGAHGYVLEHVRDGIVHVYPEPAVKRGHGDDQTAPIDGYLRKRIDKLLEDIRARDRYGRVGPDEKEDELASVAAMLGIPTPQPLGDIA